MEFKTVYGCLVEHMQSEDAYDAYAHQANCFCRMRRGIAPQLANANPEVREVDNATVEGDRDKMGTFTKTSNKPYVYNLYGQYHWYHHQVVPGRNTDYPKLYEALVKLRDDMLNEGLDTLGIPLIGCGVAGGDWDIVSGAVNGIFRDTDIKVTLFIKEQ